MCQVLISLGYYLNLDKCVFDPTQNLKFLGLICDSKKFAFTLPDDKRRSFCSLRDSILKSEVVDMKTLQRFAGKCISLILAVPTARLHSIEVNRTISLASRNSKPIKVYQELKQEIECWNFLDEWTGVLSWRKEKYFRLDWQLIPQNLSGERA